MDVAEILHRNEGLF